MIIIKDIQELKSYLSEKKKVGSKIGFVPTMGYLHEGHMSLAQKSVMDNDVTVMSIFVNPTQFGPNEDFDKYPRDLEADSKLAKNNGVDVIFAPTVNEMYPENYSTFVNVEGVTEYLCGQSRPGHFKGVATVVLKLFNIIMPDNVYFGQKDYQQCLVIKQMIEDLNLNICFNMCPIVRENDGLAKSSRNKYLNEEERKQAICLYKALLNAQNQYENGETNIMELYKSIEDNIKTCPLAQIDYISIVDALTLQSIEHLHSETLIALAVKFGNTRLIDNIILGGAK